VVNDAAEKTSGTASIPDLTFTAIRAEPMFERMSSQMLRLMDMGQMKGIQIQNYEYTAAQEFK
jgi:hypothetical protein